MLKVYGIKNCDTVRKSLKWLEENNLSFEFQDFRKDPVASEDIQRWEKVIGRAKLINKRGTTYRKLTENEKSVLEGDTPFQMLSDNPTLMKRPVFDDGTSIMVGFTEIEKQALLES
ncbi:Spx/MgsR family RNA polymerase-binding regulatory protein [Sneathiella sp. P13V-1]|uniref:Spx/MgsR family RNA polymerase-binding regulatory protein n=1 Tax=Sneathiella sp. P13V-1 TaxID=2697366 RepID=UPI00187B4578|nr:Spx/MgsR family RNA polymerase-binding regulatory protein [Sneathiella sp. P13V-1]MBE7637647.1 Spx/MgsR family RNA polymerase-binding regulatory protein [Sneathiella sp. P13V-1]